MNIKTTEVIQIKYLISSLILIILSIVFIGHHYLPISSFLIYNADILYIGDISRSLNLGTKLFDWRLTQAPYLFPDIFLGRLLIVFGISPQNIGYMYQFIYPLILYVYTVFLSKINGVDHSNFVPAFLVLYLGALVGDVFAGQILPFLFFIGFHSGVLFGVLLTLIAFSAYCRANSKRYLAVPIIIVLVVYCSISDLLYVITLFPVMLLATSFAWRRKLDWVKYSMELTAIFFTAFLLSKLFLLTNPFPQEQEFLGKYISMFPHLIIPASKNFLRDILKFSRSGYVPLLLLLSVVSSVVFNAIEFTRTIKRNGSLSEFLILGIGSISLLLVLFVQLIFGLYDDIFSARQWAPLIFLTVYASCYAINKRLLALFVYFCVCVILTVILTVSYVDNMKGYRGKIVSNDLYNSFIDCMKKTGIKSYISDYWIARPIRMYSGYAIEINPYLGADFLFTNAGNVAAIRTSKPDAVIVGGNMRDDAVTERFGFPTKVMCEMTLVNRYSLKIFDYRDNNFAKEVLRNDALNAY